MTGELSPILRRIGEQLALYSRALITISHSGGRAALQRALEAEQEQLRLRALGGRIYAADPPRSPGYTKDEGPGMTLDELLGKIDDVLADEPSNRGSA